MSVLQPATFLELCQRTAQEAGMTQLVDEPSTVVGQVGDYRRVVAWVADAWRMIQGRRHFSWMWERPTLTMLTGTSTLAGTIPEQRYLKERLYVPVVGQMGYFPEFMPWDQFSLIFPFISPGPRFNVWSIAPDSSIHVDVAVTEDVPFFVERYKLPTQLVADADEPGMPVDLRMLIVYTALVKNANFDEAGIQRRTAVDEVTDLQTDLFTRCLPEPRLGGTLEDATS